MNSDPNRHAPPKSEPASQTVQVSVQVPRSGVTPIPEVPAPALRTPPGVQLFYLAGTCILCALGTRLTDHFIAGVAPRSGSHYVLLLAGSLSLITFFICGLELMLSILQRLGIPALTLNQVRKTFNGVMAGARVGGGGALWLALKSVLIQPQFMLTLLIGTGFGVATVATVPAPPPGGPDPTKQLEALQTQLNTIANKINRLQAPLLAIPARFDSVDAEMAQIKTQLPAEGFEPRLMRRFDSAERSFAALTGKVSQLSAGDASLSQQVHQVSANVDETEANVSAAQTTLATNTNTLEKILSSLDEVSRSVTTTSDVLGTQLPRHPWSGFGPDPTLATEIYRLVQHEDTLDKRISRLFARGALVKVMEDPLPRPAQTAQSQEAECK